MRVINNNMNSTGTAWRITGLALFFLFVLCATSLVTIDVYSFEGTVSGIPDLCYQCHTQLREELDQPRVHAPFRQGMCASCHKVHAGKHKGLIKEDVNSLCLGCHRQMREDINKQRVHGAIKNGLCTDCHKAHSGKLKNLLVKKESEICTQCHEISMEEMRRTASVHQPYKRGECSSCHDAHVSSRESLLKNEPGKMCSECHAPRCKAGGVSITHITRSMDCTTCHSGHSSRGKSLLGPYGHSGFMNKTCDKCHNPIVEGGPMTTRNKGDDLCFRCHVKDPAKFSDSNVHGEGGGNSCTMCHEIHGADKSNLTINETELCKTCHGDVYDSIAKMEKDLENIRCLPVKNRKCFGCHTPLHSKKPLFFRYQSDIIKTCADCHESQHKVTHPLGEGVIDPRNNEIMTCKSCHSMHNAPAEFMLQFDRKRELCIQCHVK